MVLSDVKLVNSHSILPHTSVRGRPFKWCLWMKQQQTSHSGKRIAPQKVRICKSIILHASSRRTCANSLQASARLLVRADADMYGSINDAVASLRKVAKLYSSERRWDGMTVFNPK
eukprot:12696-Heterococcus_DN1.PRE.1